MPQTDLIVRNGTIVNSDKTFQGDIAVADRRIVDVKGRIDYKGKTEIDAQGMLVFPGGIDSHCHVSQVSSSGVKTADNFLTATQTAAFGGITTIIPFAAQKKGESLKETIADYHRASDDYAIVDYAFHIIISDVNVATITTEMKELIEQGYTSFKVYMTYDAVKLSDKNIIRVLDIANQHGVTVMVHAESDDLLTWLTEKLVEENKVHTKFHADARPKAVEREAVHRAISMTEVIGARMLLVHVSGAESVEQLRWAKSKKIKIYAETCPQYLTLTFSELDRPNFEGAKYCCSPPLRDDESISSLWKALEDEIIEIYSSDHSVYRFDDPSGKKAFGMTAPFYRIPMGIPGLATSLPILFSEGVVKRGLSLEKFARLTSWNAAKLYGLSHCKGRIEIGYDADFAIWDESRINIIQHEAIEGVADYSPYEGMELKGWPVTTISGGDVVCHEGKVRDDGGHGQFLRCGLGRAI